jgi:acyl-CoA dehydrogenase
VNLNLDTLGFGRKLYSPEHEAYRASVRRFFKAEIEPNIKRWEKEGCSPRELQRQAGKVGILCPGIPEEYGGGGGDMLHQMILAEEHGYSTAGAALEAGLTIDIVSYPILYSGTEEQRREWLPRFAAGEVISEIGLTESGGGSDTRAIKTYARRDGDDYVINGSKMWMANGPELTMLLVVAKTEAKGGSRENMTVFIVNFNEVKGVTAAKPTELMLKGVGVLGEVFFDEVRVPARCILGGQEGTGLGKAYGLLSAGRLANAARWMAACELALLLTVQYAKNRKAYGQTVLDFQNTQFKLASVLAEVTVGRTYLDTVLERLVGSNVDFQDACIAKLWVSELEARVMDECLQFFGGFGYANEFPISKMYAFARVHRIYLGTSEIQRKIIARGLFS